MEISKDTICEMFYYKEGHLWNKHARGRAKKDECASYIDSNGYGCISINNNKYCEHRLIWIMQNGSISDDSQIDHIDRNKYNNNIENLRLVTQMQNQWNTGAKGCYWDARVQKYRAQIRFNGTRKHLGYFVTETDAIQAYEKAKSIHHKMN